MAIFTIKKDDSSQLNSNINIKINVDGNSRTISELLEITKLKESKLDVILKNVNCTNIIKKFKGIYQGTWNFSSSIFPNQSGISADDIWEIITNYFAPILWNKLGSADEVQNSEIGKNGQFEGGIDGYSACKFDNGIEVSGENSTDEGVYFDYTSNKISKSVGAIDCWLKLDFTSESAGTPGDGINSRTIAEFRNSSDRMIIYARSSNVATAKPGVTIDGNLYTTTNLGWTAGELFHLAVTWDESSSEIKIYKNDSLTDTLSITTWSSNDYDYISLCNFNDLSPNWLGWRGLDGIMDNVKVWDFIKTDYSDKNIEKSFDFEIGDGLIFVSASTWNLVKEYFLKKENEIKLKTNLDVVATNNYYLHFNDYIKGILFNRGTKIFNSCENLVVNGVVEGIATLGVGDYDS